MTVFGPPLKEYDGRATLRSLADALAKLQELGGLSDGDVVEIKTAGLTLPDGRLTGFVTVLGLCRADGSRWVIRMPSSGKFTARGTFGERHTYNIAVLNGARSDLDGNISLANGEFLHQVDLRATPFLRDLSETEEAIVEHALKFLGAEDQCYFPLHDSLPPDVQLLHYEEVAKIRIPSLKSLQYAIQKEIPGVSYTFIANTLKFAGMRFPRAVRVAL
jgi:hypothetical protein